ncbi:putative entry exclusion protein TrbK-alt [Aureimonas altamirensis]|uniref:putative entry exclusion protein TrbK-alt n=1 Tax=Aureimonas altamirensis TaxID=370622 RepID=UPI001E4DA468|nr:putative entry exclusion protein TrbK-alt [Aureimonas altamirensis]UHD46355.1 putative entry exclusion protein TrbK-alt [Aureimonas altamirensis]
MDGKMLARLGAAVFIVFAVTVSAIDMAREDSPPAATAGSVLRPIAEPPRETLRHCQQLGEAAARDAECLAAWAESRDRFLGHPPSPAPPGSTEGR